MHTITSKSLAWIDDAVGYDNVATVRAAYDRLLEFRCIIDAGNPVTVFLDDSPQEFDSAAEFDTWVCSRYPVFACDVLHSAFNL